MSGSKSQRILNSGIVYISYLVFQLFSHASLYADEGEGMNKSTTYGHKDETGIEMQTRRTDTVSSGTSTAVVHQPDIESGSANLKEPPQLGVWVTVGLLIVVTAVGLLYFYLLLSCTEAYISWSQLPLSG